MFAIIAAIHFAIQAVIWVLIINAVLSWLIAFDVINRRNRLVDTIWDLTNRLTEPLLRPIRKVIPLIGGVDLSPMVLVLVLIFLDTLVVADLPRLIPY